MLADLGFNEITKGFNVGVNLLLNQGSEEVAFVFGLEGEARRGGGEVVAEDTV